jgi:integrase
VNGAKTDQAARKVKIVPALHAELSAAISPSATEPDALIFPTRTGRQLGPDNFRNRVLAPAVKRANENLARRGSPPLPKLTPHSLRRTWVSVKYALGADPGEVMDEAGHVSSALALDVYCQPIRRDEDQTAKLRAMIARVD